MQRAGAGYRRLDRARLRRREVLQVINAVAARERIELVELFELFPAGGDNQLAVEQLLDLALHGAGARVRERDQL